MGFSKQGKKPGWRTSSNCVQSAFFRLSPSGRNEKTPLGSNSTRTVSYYNFEWAFPSRAKIRVDERRPIAFKTRFFDFPHLGETKKHPWDRIPRGRFHTTILSGLFQAGQKAGLTNVVQLRSITRFFDFPHRGKTNKHHWDRIPRGRFHTTILSGLFQAGQKAGLTNVVQLRSKRVFSTFLIGAKRKNTLGIEFHEVGFIPPFWVGFSKQGKKPRWRTSSNCVQNAFFRLSPSWQNEKTPLGSNSTRTVSYYNFEWAFPSRAKSRVDERRPIAFKTRFFDSPHRGETKKHPWDRIPRGRFHTTILSGLFEAGQKAALTNVVQLRSKRVFSTFHIGAKRKNTLFIEFHEVGFILPFWVGFSKQGKKPGWRTSSNCVQNAFFRLSPSGRNEKTPLGSNSTRSVSYYNFEWAFPSRAKSRVDERRPIAFNNAFFRLSPSGQNEKTPLGLFPRGRFHTTILSGLFQAGQKAGLTNVVQLRSKRVFSTFPIGAKRKNTLGIEFHEIGFIPPFWVGFSKQGKKPRWRTSSNCVQNAFFRLSPSWQNEKTPLGSNSTRTVSYYNFEWAFPSRAKSRVDERRPIAFKTRFLDSPHRGETKKHPWDRIPRGRFHTTILSGLFQAGQKAALTNVVQLRSKRVFSTFPIVAKRKNALGIEFHEDGFILQFWVGFSKQGKKPGWRTSSNCVQNAFFRLSPSGRNEKTPLGSNSTRSVSYHHFEWAFRSRAKSRVDERRPIAFKTRFFDFPHRGETKKHPFHRIPRGRFHTTILSGLFQAGQKAGLTNVVQLRSKRVFSTFPIGAKRKNTLGIEFHEDGFILQFWVGFSKQGKKPGWRTSSNCVQNAFFRLSPSGRNEKTPLGSNSTRSVSYYNFEWAFPSREKSRVDERRPIAFNNAFFRLSPSGQNEKTPLGSFPRGRFHTTILSGLFQAGQKAGLTNVVQLRSKRVFSTFPIGAKRKNTLGIEFHEIGFIPPFWVGFSKQGKKPRWRTSSNCVQNAFFRLSPSWQNEKTPLGSNSTRTVSYYNFEWAFPSRAKSRVDERRPIAFKTRFLDSPHRGETKKHPWDRIPRGRFHTTILSGLFQAGQKAALTNVVQLRSKRVFSTFPIGAKRKNTLLIEFHEVGFILPFWVSFSNQGKKPGWRTSSNCVQNAFFRLSPSGRNEKTPLGSNSTRTVSYYNFEWAFPSRAKSRVDERRPIAFKTRFFDFPHRGETKKHPWDRIPRGRFHTTILSGLFQAGQKAALTNVVQLRSKRVFSTFPIGSKRKNTLGIEFHEVGFIPPFWVGFSKQGKKPRWRTSSNCVQNAFFRLSPSERNEKTPFWSNSTRSVSYYHFEWAFPSRAKSRVDERRPIVFKTRFFDFPHRGKTKKHPWDRSPRGRFHTTILSGLLKAGQKAGLTNVVQLRSKRVSSTFPIGENEKTPLGSKSTRSVSYHHFEWASPSRAKSRVDERRPMAFKTRVFDFPHRGETKKHRFDRIPRGRFHTTILSGLSKQGKKPGWRTSSNCVQNAFFRLSPSGRNEKTPLRSNSTRTVSYYNFEWAFPSRAKSRVDERRPIAFKTRFSTFPVWAKRKNTLGIEFHEVGFIPPFWVGFSKQGKKPGWRTSSNCVQNAFFRLSPSGRNEKTPLGSNSTRTVTTFLNPAFCPAWKSPLKMVVWNRPRGIRSQGCFFVLPQWGKSEKRILNAIGRRSSTRLFTLLGKAHSKL